MAHPLGLIIETHPCLLLTRMSYRLYFNKSSSAQKLTQLSLRTHDVVEH